LIIETRKLIVAGSRGFQTKLDDLSHLPFFETLLEGSVLFTAWRSRLIIISGMARGVDNLGYRYAKAKGIDCIECPADWSEYPARKDGGYKRNVKMASIGDGLLAIRLGQTSGTNHMIRIMQAKNLPVEIIDVEDLIEQKFIRHRVSPSSFVLD
jgi:hypothetical protein